MEGEDWLNTLYRRILFLPEQASTVAREIDWLHFFVITVTMAGAVAITVVGLVLVVKYRARGPGFRREDPAARPPLWAELLVIGGLLGLFCLWWVIGFVQYLRLQVVPAGALDVYVTGKQWMWQFAYPDGQRSIAVLYVPTGQPVRLLLGSRDVIHSFFVPSFRIKQDAVPGRVTTAWFTVKAPGTYPIYCTEYCGTGHSIMRGQVVALSPGDYARWLAGSERRAGQATVAPLAAAPAAPADITGLAGPRDQEGLSVEEYPPAEALDLVRVGEQVAAQQGCLRCHTLDGTPHIGPTWAGLYLARIPLEGGGETVADAAYLTESMMDPQAKVHRDFPAVMPSYQGFLTPADAGSIVELIRSLRALPGRPAVTPFQPPPSQQGLPPPGTQPNPPPRGTIEAEPGPTPRTPGGGR